MDLWSIWCVFSLYLCLTRPLRGICINAASSSVHSFIVLCLISWEQSTLNATLRRNSPRADSECLLFMPSMTTEHTHPEWAVSWNCPGWAVCGSPRHFSFHPASYSIYQRIWMCFFFWKTSYKAVLYILTNYKLYLFMCLNFFFPLLFIHLNASFMCWGHNCDAFKETLLLVWTVFEALQLKLKYIYMKDDGFSVCFIFVLKDNV